MANDDPGIHLLSGYGRALGTLLLYQDRGEDPSQVEMAESIGMSRQVFANYIKTLCDRGLLTRKRRRGRVYYTVVPTVHPDIDEFRRVMRFLEDSDLALATEAHPAVLEELPSLQT